MRMGSARSRDFTTPEAANALGELGLSALPRWALWTKKVLSVEAVLLSTHRLASLLSLLWCEFPTFKGSYRTV